MTQQPTPPMQPGTPMAPGAQPHRGVLILVLGILGIVLCQILGIFAWVMGNNDLKAMQVGTMDRTGEGLTQAGRICGIVSVVLLIVGVCMSVLWIVLMVVFAGAAAAGSASGGSGAGG